MARGVTLSAMVSMLRYETGKAAGVNAGTDMLDQQKHMLQRAQRLLYQAHDWPFLRVFPTKALAAGQRYYDWPTTLDRDRVDGISVDYGGEYVPLHRGIGFDEYSAYDSDQDERSDPAMRWEQRWTGSATQLEIWPIPASNDYSLRFTGLRPLLDFVADDDVCTLDADLIVLTAAIDLLPKDSDKLPEKKAARNQLLHDLQSAHATPTRRAIMGGADPYAARMPRKLIVRVS